MASLTDGRYYYFTVQGVLPTRQIYSWPLEIGVSSCGAMTIGNPNLVPQLYYVTQPYA